MEWREQTLDGFEIILLKGDIDLQHSPKLRELLQAKISEQAPTLLLDFSDVRYIDSSGLATLIEYYQKSRRYSGQLAIYGMSERVKSVFELVRLSEIFFIFATGQEAIDGLSGQS
jgi:anti-sigma B factor antagonist